MQEMWFIFKSLRRRNRANGTDLKDAEMAQRSPALQCLPGQPARATHCALDILAISAPARLHL